MRESIARLVQFISRQGQRLARAAESLWYATVRGCVANLRAVRRLAHTTSVRGRGCEFGVRTITDAGNVTWTVSGGTGPGHFVFADIVKDEPPISIARVWLDE